MQFKVGNMKQFYRLTTKQLYFLCQEKNIFSTMLEVIIFLFSI